MKDKFEKACDKMVKKYGNDFYENEDAINELMKEFGVDARIVCMVGIVRDSRNWKVEELLK